VMRPAVSASSTTQHAVNADDQYAQHIRRIVDEAPPLTAEQRDRLAVLLLGAGAVK